MKINIYILLLLLPITLIAKNFSLSSKTVDFDGEKLKLSGDIFLEHDLGDVKAKEAVFEKEKNGKLSNIFLYGDVTLHLKNGGHLLSEAAHLDLEKQTIELTSKKQKIKLEDFLLAGKKPLFLSGYKVKCRLTSKSIKKPSIQDVIFISFYDDVEITYDNDIHFKGDKAKYIKSKNIDGEILLKTKQNLCLFDYLDNKASANFCHIDLASQTIQMKKAKGYCNTNLGKIDFSSKKLTVDKIKEQIVLQDDVTLFNSHIGTLLAETAEIFKNKIKTDGTTTLFLPEKKRNISCNGHVILDNDKKILIAKAMHEDEQVILKDNDINLFTDQLIVNYQDNFKINNMILEGNINAILENNIYGNADKAIYSFEKKELCIKSDPDKRVVFWQKNNNMKLSAKELKINNNNDIEGIGNVRCSFDLTEGKHFKQLFNKYAKKYERNPKGR
jgi:lipopolysaccharide export system protein LptA